MEKDLSGRDWVLEELRRVREAVRDRALVEPGQAALPSPLEVKVPGPMPPDPEIAAEAPPPRPGNADLNALWRLRGALEGGGWKRGAARWLLRLASRLVDAQEAFNSRQVRFDNELLDYIDARIEATHRHYDRVLGVHGRHMGEIDERHFIVQEELVAHVHDLVRRIDLVLAEGERGRISLETALTDLRARVERLGELTRER